MSISQSLTNAVSGLTVNARRAEVISSNLANASTDGYARRELLAASQTLGGISAGVRITGILRHVDPIVLGDRRQSDGDVAFASAQADVLARLEDQIGIPDSQDSLSGRMNALEVALNSAAADPSSGQRLTQAVDRMSGVTTRLNEISDSVVGERERADQQIATDVTDLNTALQQVVKLNADISRSVLSGNDPAALMDQRQVVIDGISKIVPVQESRRPQGQVALLTMSGTPLLDGAPAVVGFQATPTMTADLSISDDTLSGLTINGRAAGEDGVGILRGGTLHAQFVLRDQTLVGVQQDIDDVALDLINRLSDPAVDPTLLGGIAGLLTDRGGPYVPNNSTGLAGRIQINTNVDPKFGGDVTRLRDGIGASSQGPVGQNAQLLRFATALETPRFSSRTGMKMTASTLIADASERLSSKRLDTEKSATFASARRDALQTAELAGGVDTDAELQRLLQVEQAYAANARLMQTIQDMMQRLMEI